MSYAIDSNLLLYASDRSSRFYERSLVFLRGCAAGPELLILAWPVLMAYLRIATHPSVFDQPLSPSEAVRNLDSLLGLPHVRTISEGEAFWPTYRALSAAVVARGNLVPDAHLAALLLDNGVTTLFTHDRDFRRFEGLRTRDPLE